jgi:hypothetical protein
VTAAPRAPVPSSYPVEPGRLGRVSPETDEQRRFVMGSAEDELAEELSEGALDPDEVDPLLDPWDDGADDET